MSFEHEAFIGRHIGPSDDNVQTMLALLGYKDLDTFTKAVVPATIAISEHIEKVLPKAATEVETIAQQREIATQNKVPKTLMGTSD